MATGAVANAEAGVEKESGSRKRTHNGHYVSIPSARPEIVSFITLTMWNIPQRFLSWDESSFLLM